MTYQWQEKIKALEAKCSDLYNRLLTVEELTLGIGDMESRIEQLETAIRELAETGQFIVKKLDQTEEWIARVEIRLTGLEVLSNQLIHWIEGLEERMGEMIPENDRAVMPIVESPQWHISDQGLVRESGNSSFEDAEMHRVEREVLCFFPEQHTRIDLEAASEQGIPDEDIWNAPVWYEDSMRDRGQ